MFTSCHMVTATSLSLDVVTNVSQQKEKPSNTTLLLEVYGVCFFYLLGHDFWKETATLPFLIFVPQGNTI